MSLPSIRKRDRAPHTDAKGMSHDWLQEFQHKPHQGSKANKNSKTNKNSKKKDSNFRLKSKFENGIFWNSNARFTYQLGQFQETW